MNDDSDATAIVHEKQMGFSRRDFVRTLPRVFGPDTYQVNGDRMTWSDGDGRAVDGVGHYLVERLLEQNKSVQVGQHDVYRF